MSPLEIPREVGHVCPELVTHRAERFQSGRLVALDGRGVGQTPVQRLEGAAEERTRFLRFVARRDHDVEVLAGKLVDGLAALSGDVEPQL